MYLILYNKSSSKKKETHFEEKKEMHQLKNIYILYMYIL